MRPISFSFGSETAANDFFQKNLGEKPDIIEAKALIEFDVFVQTPSPRPRTASSRTIGSSPWGTAHWFSAPMFAPDRHTERIKFLGTLVGAIGRDRLTLVDYTRYEQEHRFLEGTGAMVLDRVNRKAHACLSERCDEGLFRQFCSDCAFTPILFHGFQTYQGQRVAIYHTNVMMALGEMFAVVCLSAIDDEDERRTVVAELTRDGKEIIDMSESEIDRFAGNEIQVLGADDRCYTS